MMTINEIKAKLLERFTNGKGRCADGRGCKYRFNDNACAVGYLISDNMYTPNIESAVVHDLVITGDRWAAEDQYFKQAASLSQVFNDVGIPATGEIFELLEVAQDTHDDPTNWDGTEFIGDLSFLK